MAVVAARSGLVKVCATDGSFTTLGNVTSIDASGWHVSKMMELTCQGDAAARNSASGFYENTLSVSGNYDAADAGMVILLAQMATNLYVEYLPNGTAGFKQQVVVTDFKLSPKAGAEALGFSVTFAPAAGAAPAAV